MKISLSEGTWDKSTADIVAIAVPSGKTKLNRALGRIEAVTGKGSIKPLASDERFEGKASQTLKVAAGGKAKSRWLLLVGIGEVKDVQKVAWKMGHALATVARAQKSAAVELPAVTPESVRAVSQGLVGGAYRYTEYKSDKKERRDAHIRCHSRRPERRARPHRCGPGGQSGRRKRQFRP
jgi:leucyl aminopeptidase